MGKTKIKFGETGWTPLTLKQITEKAEEDQRKRKAAFDAQLAKTRAEMQRRNRDYLTTSNDNTAVSSGKPQNEHLKERFSEGAKSHAEWEKEHPNATAWGTALSATPFAIASLPALTAGGSGLVALGDAAASTAAGQALTGALNGTVGTVLRTSALGVPLSTWGLTGLDAAMVAHGANSVRQGEFNPMTALELLPAAKIAKPAIKVGTTVVKPAITGKAYQEPTVRLYRASGTNGNFKPSPDGTQEFSGMWFTDNPTKPQRYASLTVKRAKLSKTENPIELQYVDIPESKLKKI